MSGSQRRKLRVAAGLPKYTPREAASRRASDSRRAVERRRRNSAQIAAFKIDKGCADCGYNAHPAALEFDHLPGFEKVANVNALMGSNAPLARILEEMGKCEVVCANCHRIRTANRSKSLAADT